MIAIVQVAILACIGSYTRRSFFDVEGLWQLWHDSSMVHLRQMFTAGSPWVSLSGSHSNKPLKSTVSQRSGRHQRLNLGKPSIAVLGLLLHQESHTTCVSWFNLANVFFLDSQ